VIVVAEDGDARPRELEDELGDAVGVEGRRVDVVAGHHDEIRLELADAARHFAEETTGRRRADMHVGEVDDACVGTERNGVTSDRESHDETVTPRSVSACPWASDSQEFHVREMPW
jgi:hypothetical protein